MLRGALHHPELKEKEALILGADERIMEMEYERFV